MHMVRFAGAVSLMWYAPCFQIGSAVERTHLKSAFTNEQSVQVAPNMLVPARLALSKWTRRSDALTKLSFRKSLPARMRPASDLD